MTLLKESLTNHKHIYLVGIKGTGVCALAELLLSGGARISGSDTDDVFYTDEILKSLKIPYYENFDAAHVPVDAALVIHSAAYGASNAELAEAARRGIPVINYPKALGAYSALFDSSGIAGVHGKTTTTALAGSIAAALGLPARVLAGSASSAFGGRCTFDGGGRFFIAETCEYRRHFLNFCPRRIVLTSVESDHQDYYPSYASIRDAFIEYASMLPQDGSLIYCADDAGAKEVASYVSNNTIPYGFSADGLWRVESSRVQNERLVFKLAAFKDEFTLRVPGTHNVLNAAAALALNYELYFADVPQPTGTQKTEFAKKAAAALADFRGSKRRAEVLGEAGGILFMDDYGHHPTAIKTTLRGLKEFYPQRRLIVSFMPHTYSRTAALLDGFAAAFADADELVLHKIYASAREAPIAKIDGKTLFEQTKKHHHNVRYFEEPMDFFNDAKHIDAPALFLTLGAGDNWKLGKAIFAFLGGGDK